MTIALLLINIGNQRVFFVLTSVAIILFYLAYMCVTGPLLLRRLRGDWPRADHGPYFSMGGSGCRQHRRGHLPDVVVINLAWPRPDVYGTDHWYLQWGAFIFIGATILIGGIYYFVAAPRAAERGPRGTPSGSGRGRWVIGRRWC